MYPSKWVNFVINCMILLTSINSLLYSEYLTFSSAIGLTIIVIVTVFCMLDMRSEMVNLTWVGLTYCVGVGVTLLYVVHTTFEVFKQTTAGGANAPDAWIQVVTLLQLMTAGAVLYAGVGRVAAHFPKSQDDE